LSSSWPCSSFEVWLTQCFADNLDIFYMFVEMGNDERTEMQLKFQDSPYPSVFVTTPKVGGTGLIPTAANHAVITRMFWVLNEQRLVIARVARLGQNRVPHTLLLNTRPNGYDIRASDLHPLSGVAQMRVLHGLMNRPNITTKMIYRNLECVRTIRSSLRSMETLSCQMVKMNDNYQGSEIKVRLFNHSTNTISPADAK